MQSSNDPIYSTPPTNRQSIISLILGALTVILFCGNFLIPLPFTSLICLPLSFLLGIAALIYGMLSLNRIRKHNESGGFMAWTGIVSGGMVFLCVLCMIVTVASLFIFSPDTIQPIIDGYSL
jgi:uncharacterized membrane protein